MRQPSFVAEGTRPSALLTDGLIAVPLHAVSVITLSQTYHLPPFGAGLGRAMIDTHDDTMSLSALLVGPKRMAARLALETLAESAMRGSVLSVASGGLVDGLILVTAFGLRLNMFIQSLTVTASASKREAIDVSISLVQAPRLGLMGKLLDVAGAVAAIGDGT
ncbi:MAG: hypothetical protein JSS07_12300 [Proteobacteria bacterium]|nr:hypothetical protein [Pseudomonadota bacterium]